MNGQNGVTQIQKQPGKFKKAMNASGRFFRNTLIAGILLGSTLAPTNAFSQKMFIHVPERSLVKSSDHLTPKMKSLIPDLITEGIVANEQEALNLLGKNFSPVLKSSLYNQNLINAFENEFVAFNRTSPPDFGGKISVYNFNTKPNKGNWDFAWTEMLGITVSPARIYDCKLFAKQTVNASNDTIDVYTQKHTPTSSPIYTLSTTFLTKLGTDYLIFNLTPSYSFSTESILPASVNIQILNSGKRWYISPDFVSVSKISNENWFVDAGASAGVDFARAVVWGADLTGNSKLSVGINVTPDGLLGYLIPGINDYVMSTFYAMGREQRNNASGWNKNIEALVGARVDFNIADRGVLSGIVEYNSSSDNYHFMPKPNGWSVKFNASIVFPDVF